jgi:hypothetical protein
MKIVNSFFPLRLENENLIVHEFLRQQGILWVSKLTRMCILMLGLA